MIFRLRTGHYRLGAHLHKLKVVTTPQCHWNTEHQTPEHVLQRCPTYDSIRKNNGRKIWGRKRRPAADCGVHGRSKPHDLNSRSIKKLYNDDDDDEDEEEDEFTRTKIFSFEGN